MGTIKTTVHDYVLVFAAHEEDRKEAENIHDSIQTIGLNGQLCGDIATESETSMVQTKLETLRQASIVFFLVTDNLACDASTSMFNDDTLWNELHYSSHHRHLIPLLLNEKSQLKPRENRNFAALMSRVPINVKQECFHNKLKRIKTRLDVKKSACLGKDKPTPLSNSEGPTKNTFETGNDTRTGAESDRTVFLVKREAPTDGNLDVPQEGSLDNRNAYSGTFYDLNAETDNKSRTLSNFVVPASKGNEIEHDPVDGISTENVKLIVGENNNWGDIETDDVPSPSPKTRCFKDPLAKHLMNAPVHNTQNQQSEQTISENCPLHQDSVPDEQLPNPLHPKSMLMLMRAFNKCQSDDIAAIVSKLHERGIITPQDKHSVTEDAGGEKESKDTLLTLLLSKDGMLANDDLIRLMLDTCMSRIEYRHKQSIYQTILRILGNYLQFKIQNAQQLIDGFWSGTILVNYELHDISRHLEINECKANAKLIHFLKLKDEQQIKTALDIIRSHVSADCRSHIEHTTKALQEGNSPPECCSRLEHLSTDDIEKIICGPYQRRMKRCFSDIVKNLSDIEDVMDCLFSKNVISYDQLERLDIPKTTSGKARKLIMEIYKQDEDQVIEFVNVLKNSTGSNPTIASWLEQDVDVVFT